MKYTLIIFTVFITSFNLFSQNISLDKSFGDNGIIKESFGEAYEVLVFDVKVLEEGGYLYSLVVFEDTEEYYLLAKYSASGQLDTTFADKGYYKCNLELDYIPKTLVFPSGFIGFINMDDEENFIITFLDNNGNLVFNYKVDIGSDYYFSVNDIVYSDEWLYIGGDFSTIVPGSNRADSSYVFRIDGDGLMDATFADGGIYKFGADDTDSELYNMRIVEDGILINSQFYGDGEGYGVILKLDSNGELDDDFADSGVIIIDNSETEYSDISVDSAGGIYFSFFEIPAVFKFTKDGELDKTYGNGGVAYDQKLAGLYFVYFSHLNNGEVYIFGSFSTGEAYGESIPAIVKYDSSGQLDTLFGDKGVFKQQLDQEYGKFYNGIIDSEGKLVAVGGVIDKSEVENSELPKKIFIARYKYNTASTKDNPAVKINSSLYPNPALGGEVNYLFELKYDSDILIELLDLTGKKVDVLYKGMGAKGINNLVLSVPENIHKGFYVIKLSTKTGCYISKLEVLD